MDEEMIIPAVKVYPNEVLVDEKFSIVVTGLRPDQKITIKTTIKEGQAIFTGCGWYVARDDGRLDVSTMSSIGGTYTGVDSMGLIWSMRQSPGQRPGLMLVHLDVTKPQIVDLTVYSGHWSFDDIHLNQSLELLTETQIKRWYMAKDLQRIPVKVGRIRGTIFVPKGPGQFPGIVDIDGMAGGCKEYRPSLLASRGFIVLALAYLLYDDLPKTPDFDLDYFIEGVKYVYNYPKVKPGGIGLHGMSKGGEICQLLAIHCPEVKALVSVNGFPALTRFDMRFGDQILKTQRPLNWSLTECGSEGVIMKDMLQHVTCDFFHLWERDCRMLSICSEDDFDMDPVLQQLQYDMYPDDQKHKIELVKYPGAGHSINPPYAPLFRTIYNHIFKVVMLMGGYPKEHAYAQEDVWERTLKFFKANI